MSDEKTSKAVAMGLWCPKCNTRHFDRGEWATRLHKTHRCETCRNEWRPYEYATVGVADAELPAPTQTATQSRDSAWRSFRNHGDTIAPSLDFSAGFLAGREQGLREVAPTDTRLGDALVKIQALLNKVNKVTAWHRHQPDFRIPKGPLDELCDRQLEVEKWLNEVDTTPPAPAATQEGSLVDEIISLTDDSAKLQRSAVGPEFVYAAKVLEALVDDFKARRAAYVSRPVTSEGDE